MKKCIYCETEYEEDNLIGCPKCYRKKRAAELFWEWVFFITVIAIGALFAYGCHYAFGKYALAPFLIIGILYVFAIMKRKEKKREDTLHEILKILHKVGYYKGEYYKEEYEEYYILSEQDKDKIIDAALRRYE